MLSDWNYLPELIRVFISLIYSNRSMVLNIRPNVHTHIVKYILSVHSESILSDLYPYKPSFGFFFDPTDSLWTHLGSYYLICFISWTNVGAYLTEELIGALNLVIHFSIIYVKT
jgi:hypothetical protein